MTMQECTKFVIQDSDYNLASYNKQFCQVEYKIGWVFDPDICFFDTEESAQRFIEVSKKSLQNNEVQTFVGELSIKVVNMRATVNNLGENDKEDVHTDIFLDDYLVKIP
jgi:hypothetical protein